MGIGESKRMITCLGFSYIALLLLVIVAMSTKLERGECVSVETTSSPACNGTVGECGQVDEFLMESEVGRRLLGQKPPIADVYKVLREKGQSLCGDELQQNCVQQVNNQYSSIHCTIDSRCDKNGIRPMD